MRPIDAESFEKYLIKLRDEVTRLCGQCSQERRVVDTVIARFQDLPTLDVAPVVHAHWAVEKPFLMSALVFYVPIAARRLP